MGLIDTIKRLWSRSPENPSTPLYSLDTDIYYDPTVQVVTKRGAMQVSTVWRCVNLIAGTIASLPCVTYRQNGERREVARTHPAYKLLHDEPNPAMTAFTFWEFVSASLLLDGNAYALVRWYNNGFPAQIIPLRPESVEILDVDGKLAYRFSLSPGGEQEVVFARDILHIPGLGFDGVKGMSVISAVCTQAVGLSMALDSTMGSIAGKGIRASGVVEVDAALSPEALKRLRSQFDSAHGGPQNAGRTVFLDKGMSWKPMQINPVDAQLLEQRRFQVADICRIFGVPPHMVGETDKTTSWGSGIEQLTIAFVQYTIRPWLERIEQEVNRKLFTGQYYAEFNLDGLLRGDTKTRAEYYASGIQNGWITPNEVRKLENLDPHEGGDDLFLQTNMMRLKDITAQNGSDQNDRPEDAE
jgi:HK97 family phage portal protein